jgi:hypothetical protein
LPLPSFDQPTTQLHLTHIGHVGCQHLHDMIQAASTAQAGLNLRKDDSM